MITVKSLLVLSWVPNLEHELRQLEEDKQAELDEMDATLKVQNRNNPTPTPGGDNE